MEQDTTFKQTVFSLSEEGKTTNTRSNAFIVVIMPSDRAAKISYLSMSSYFYKLPFRLIVNLKLK